MACESCLSSGDERGEFWSFCPGRTVKRRMEWKLPWRRAEATKRFGTCPRRRQSRCRVYASSPAGLHATGGHVFIYWDRVVVVGSLRRVPIRIPSSFPPAFSFAFFGTCCQVDPFSGQYLAATSLSPVFVFPVEQAGNREPPIKADHNGRPTEFPRLLSWFVQAHF